MIDNVIESDSKNPMIGIVGKVYFGVDVVATSRAAHITSFDRDSLSGKTVFVCGNDNELEIVKNRAKDFCIDDKIKFESIKNKVIMESLNTPKTFVIHEMPELDPLPFFDRNWMGHHNAHIQSYPKKRGVKHKRRK